MCRTSVDWMTRAGFRMDFSPENRGKVKADLIREKFKVSFIHSKCIKLEEGAQDGGRREVTQYG